tara:strand:- start:1007 stop:2152 length:1146 start_codon:yes stop_codon:yes gene_type:complete
MKNIAIIGAGISGLYLANLFKDNKDYKVTIYEKKSSLDTNEGYGIQLSVNSVALLNKIGFNSITDREKFNPKKIDFYEIKNLKKLCDLEISKFNSENCKYTTLKRSILLKFLMNGLKDQTINYNYNLNRIENHDHFISLNFDNGEKKKYDQLIISDGVFSKGKSIISDGKSNPIYNTSIAIRGSISQKNFLNLNQENISLFLGPDFHYVIYPVDKSKNLNFIGILKYKLTSKEQKNYNLFDENSFTENIRYKFSRKISSIIFESLQNIKFFPVFVSKDIYRSPKNIFLVGDAFFAFPPSFAQGASQSIEGAYELYDSILSNNNFFTSRSKRVKMINLRSNLNQLAFHCSNPFVIFLRNIFLKYLTKNKKFLEIYLEKIYKN